jgi:hypothetical protein
MKFSKTMIAQAVGSAIAVCAGSQALAVSAASYDEATQVTVYVSGATATRPGLLNLFKLNAANNGVCNDGTLDLYQAADNLKYLALCTGRDTITPALPTALRGTRIAMLKSDDGGSGNGVAPLVRPTLGTALPDFWDMSGGGAFLAACAGTIIAASGSFAQYTLHTGCANTPTIDKVPEVGISDLEPGIFRTVFTPALTSTELGAIKGGGGISAVIFGVPVTLNVRDNMQRAQFADTSTCHPDNAGYTAATSESVDCMPSLTQPQLASLYGQVYTSWSKLVGINGTVASPTGAGTGHDLGTAGDVFVCRRVVTSGTQAVFETQLFAQRCVPGVPGFVTADADQLAPPQHVFEGSGSGNVQTCLKDRNAEGNGAIGILSMEFAANTSRTSADSGYRFVKLNGVPPCLLPTIQSKYTLLGESTMQWRSQPIAGLVPLPAPKSTLAAEMRSRIGSPAVVNDLNTSTNFQHGFCVTSGLGTAALVGNALTNSAQRPLPPFVVGGGGTGDVVAHPILTKSRASQGTANSCGLMIDTQATQLVN